MMTNAAIWIETQRQREAELRRCAEAHRLVAGRRRFRSKEEAGMGTTSLDVIGVPSSMAAFAPGQERTPRALRDAGLLRAIEAAGILVHDRGDAAVRRWRPDPTHPKAQNVDAVVDVVRETAMRVRESAAGGHTTLVLGGDCTVELGTIAGCRDGSRPLGLVYFDLHPDMNVPSAVPEGALDWMGMAHALALEGAVDELVGANGRAPLLVPDEVFLFAYGPDNRTAFEREQMDEHLLRGIDVREVARDPERAAVRAIAALEPDVDRILVHLDVDVIDFTDLPLSENAGRNTGLSFEHAARALRVLLSSPKLAALTVTEVNPDHDPDGTALGRLVGGLAEALAYAPALTGA